MNILTLTLTLTFVQITLALIVTLTLPIVILQAFVKGQTVTLQNLKSRSP